MPSQSSSWTMAIESPFFVRVTRIAETIPPIDTSNPEGFSESVPVVAFP